MKASPIKKHQAIAPWRWVPRLLIPLMGVLVALLFAPTLLASPIEAFVDQNPTTVGQSITLTVKISGKASGPLTLPPLPSFVSVRGPTQRSVTNIVNFEMNRYTEYTYYLTPREAKAFTINPIAATIGNKKHQSEKIRVKVLGQNPVKQGQDLFAKIDVMPESVYPGQQLNYAFHLYRDAGLEVSQFRYAPPQFEGFIEEKLGDLGEKSNVKTQNGRRYAIQTVRHALFPTRDGTLNLGDATLMVDVIVPRKGRRRGRDPFGSLFDNSFSRKTQTRTVYGASQVVVVKRLPSNAPPSFSGLVGRYRAAWSLSSASVKKGESVTLTVVVQGEGNLRGLKYALENTPNFKVYPDASQLDVSFNKRSLLMQGRKMFKFALIPLETGPLKIELPSLSWLDPKTGQYEEEFPPKLTLRVGESDSEESINAVVAPRGNSTTNIESLGHDILPPRNLTALSKSSPIRPSSPLFLGLFFAPILAFVGFFAKNHLADTRLKDPATLRKLQAQTVALQDLTTLSENEATTPAPHREFDRILKVYLGDKLGVEGLACTPKEFEQVLTQRDFPQALLQTTLDKLTAFEAAQFAPGPTSHAKFQADVAAIRALITELEGAFK